MEDQKNQPKSFGEPDVPLGWVALIIGVVMLLIWAVGRLGMITEPSPSAFPLGVALFLSGYIACFALNRVHKRIQRLEDRVASFMKENPENKKIS